MKRAEYKFGLLGKGLIHSFSPTYFTKFFSDKGLDHLSYELFDLDVLEQAWTLFSDKSILGFNVTIPYKEKIALMLDELDDVSAAVGAVNTVCLSEGKSYGFNTDVIGMRKTLKLLNLKKRNPVMILGTGGSSRALQYVLDELGFPVIPVSRTRTEVHTSYDQIDETMLSEVELIIQTTPLGMFPDLISKPPFPYRLLNSRHVLFDLHYNPRVSAFLKEGLERGCRIKNGYKMLIDQANASYDIWWEHHWLKMSKD